MKKLGFFATLIIMVVFVASAAFAQPYTANIAGDVYDDGSGTATETPADGGDGSPNIYEAINALYIAAGLGDPGFLNNSGVDSLKHLGPDNTWADLSGTDDGTFVLVGLRAGNNNTLGIYEAADPTNQTNVLGAFTGTISPAEPFTAISFSPGFDFGWTLNSVGTGGNNTYSSNPFLGAYDNGGLDHMMTYHLTELAGQTISIQFCNADGTVCDPAVEHKFNDPYLLAWEDLPLGARGPGLLGDEDYDDIMFLVDGVAPNPVPEPLSMVLFGSGLAAMAGARRKKKLS